MNEAGQTPAKNRGRPTSTGRRPAGVRGLDVEGSRPMIRPPSRPPSAVVCRSIMASVGLVESPLSVCVRVTGDLSAGVLLHQIRFHFKVGKMACRLKDGRKAVAKSNPDWAQETGLSLRQVKKGLEILRGKGVIHTDVQKFNGAPTNHIHLDEARLEVLTADLSTGSKRTDGPVRSVPIDRSVSNRSYTERSSERSAERSVASLRSATAVEEDLETESGRELAEDETETDSGHRQLEECSARLTNVIRVDFRKATPMGDSTEKYRKIAAATHQGKKSETKTVDDHMFLWAKRMGVLYEGKAKALTGQERGQMRLFMTKAGDLSFRVLDHTLQNWSKFGFECRQAYGLSTAPDRPVVGWLLKYYDVAVREYEAAVTCKKTPAAPVAKAPVAKPAPRPEVRDATPSEDKGVSKDDVRAALEALRAAKG